jgi:hypothetical protein
MTIHALAAEFTAMLKAGDHQGAATKFNDPNIRSLEDGDGPNAIAEGTAAVQAKAEWWYSSFEVHSASAAGPFVHGDQFIVRFTIDTTERATGTRSVMEEAGLYTVKDGKIVEERFFNGM